MYKVYFKLNILNIKIKLFLIHFSLLAFFFVTKTEFNSVNCENLIGFIE